MKIKNGVKQLEAVDKLEFQIEQQRTRMHQAIKEDHHFEKIIQISQDLDQLMNKLERTKKRHSVR